MGSINVYLKKNQFKKPETKQPDYRGSAKVGEKYFDLVAGWKTEDGKAISLKIDLEKIEEYQKALGEMQNDAVEEAVGEVNPDDMPF